MYLKDLLKDRKVESSPPDRSFRASLLREAFDRIDTERINSGYPPLNRKVWAIKVNSNPFLKESWQLESFVKRCRENKGGFGRLFFWALKNK